MWAAGSAVFLFIIGAWFVFKAAGSLNVQEVSSAGTALPGGAPEAVGNALFLDYLISFEAAAVFLLAAVIAAIYIAHPRGRDEKSTPGENNSDPGSENADPALAGKEAS